MPEVVVDFDAGVLRLRRPHLMTLAALLDRASPSDIDEEDLSDLRTAGLVRDDGLHPSASGIASAVRWPVLQLRLELLGPGRRVGCPGWIDSDLVVLAVPEPDGLDDIKVAHTVLLGPSVRLRWAWP